MRAARTMLGVTELAAGLVLAWPAAEMIQTAGQHGFAVVAAIGGAALGIDGVLRAADSITAESAVDASSEIETTPR